MNIMRGETRAAQHREAAAEIKHLLMDAEVATIFGDDDGLPAGSQNAQAMFLLKRRMAEKVEEIRVKSLAELELGRHIQRSGDGKVYLDLKEEDTKTGQPIDFELPSDVVRLLDAHLSTRAPYMCPPGTRYLFPQRSGARAIGSQCLAARIAKPVWTETGLQMNAHIFRHFAVMVWLDHKPGGYEVARRLLGHSETSRTINMYSGLEGRSATRAFSGLMADVKAGRQ